MGLTAIVMILVIVWAFKTLCEDLGISDRIRNGGKKKTNEE